MIVRTISRYIVLRFLGAVAAVFFGIFLLVVMLDYIELMRRSANIPNVPGWIVAATALYRVPQMAERLVPFSILVGAMVAYLNLSRRNELVVARAAGISAWQFVAPAVAAAFVVGLVAAAVYNPLAAGMGERAKQLEQSIFGSGSARVPGIGLSVRQRSDDGQSILQANASREQGASLSGVTVFTFTAEGRFLERIEAESAKLEPGFWRLEKARIYNTGAPPRDISPYSLKTNLTPEQIRESFATPETVSFWQLPLYIELAERAGLVAAGYRLQYQTLIARPFLLAAMVLMASAVSLRFFRFGGVQKMILGGIGGGFLLYVLGKVTEDLSKAELMSPVAAAWLPVLVGALSGIVILLHQEDG